MSSVFIQAMSRNFTIISFLYQVRYLSGSRLVVELDTGKWMIWFIDAISLYG